MISCTPTTIKAPVSQGIKESHPLVHAFLFLGNLCYQCLKELRNPIPWFMHSYFWGLYGR